MKEIVQGFFALLLVIVVMLGITWVVQGNNFFLYKTFAPKVEQVRYNTFKQSQAYNDGVAQDVREYKLAWTKATAEEKPGIASMILQEVASYDTTKLPPDEQAWIAQLRAQEDAQTQPQGTAQ
jgi:hypothetical protein